VQINFKFLQLLNTVYNDKFSLRMVSLIEACLWCVSRVDATDDTIGKECSKVGNNPLWRINSHYINAFPFWDSQYVHWFSKSFYISQILLERIFNNFAISFLEQSIFITLSQGSCSEHLRQSLWRLWCGPWCLHLDRQFHVNICGPIQILPVFCLHQLLITFSRY
jgi:hypothetical protein